MGSAVKLVGDAHHRTVIPDTLVTAMRTDYEVHLLTMREVARKHSVAFWTARNILRYKRRRPTYQHAEESHHGTTARRP